MDEEDEMKRDVWMDGWLNDNRLKLLYIVEDINLYLQPSHQASIV